MSTLNSPTKLPGSHRRETLASHSRKKPSFSGSPEDRVALNLMSEIIKKMGFYNVTKLQMLRSKSRSQQESDELRNMV